MTRKAAPAVLAGALTGVLASACSGPPPAANDIAGIAAAQAGNLSADLAYMREHPVPAKPGMTAGIITSVTELGDQPGTGLDNAACPSGTYATAYMAPAVGQDPCIAWSFTVVTATGAALTVSCGGIGSPCLAPQDVMPGDEGQYLYVPSSGVVTPADALQFTGCWTPVTYPCTSSAQVTP